MKKLSVIFSILLMLSCTISYAAEPMWQGKGRIVISSDGNEHDWDDWAATAMSLAVLSSQHMQDDLTMYIYSDHIWGSNQERGIVAGKSAYEQMRESALKGAELFGFDKTRMICGVDNPGNAYRALAEEINRSSAENPLFIIAAGPMQVVGEGLNQAMKEKRQYVTVISHSYWNNRHSDHFDERFEWDVHSGWTFDEMKEAFSGKKGGNCTFVQISDQNSNLKADRHAFDWLRLSYARNCSYYPSGSWDWLYSRLEVCAVENGTVFDISDTGMVTWLITGDMKVTPDGLRQLMEAPAAEAEK